MDIFLKKLICALAFYLGSSLKNPSSFSRTRSSYSISSINRRSLTNPSTFPSKGIIQPKKKEEINNKKTGNSQNQNKILCTIDSSENSESKALFNITEEQDAIICGTLLGDAHLQKRGNSSYRLKIVHSSKQKSYIDWIYKKLESLCKTTQAVTERDSSKNATIFEFYTQSNLALKKYHDLFYKEQEKIVNGVKTIFYRKTISPELIAYLPKHNYTLSTFYLDDGSARTDCYSGRFATQGYSKEECHLLQEYFNKWDLKTSVVLHSRKKNQYSLSIPAKVFPKFIEIVKEPISEIPEMVYKLNEKNRNKSSFSN